MKIVILTTGKNPFDYLQAGEAVYLKRLVHYTQVEIRPIPKIKHAKKLDDADLKQREGQALLQSVPQGFRMIALDPAGKQFTTGGFASQIQQWRNQSVPGLAFLIGGPFGLDDSIRKRADVVMSLSKLTFPHDMVRLILLEQLYRVMTVLKGEKYHK